MLIDYSDELTEIIEGCIPRGDYGIQYGTRDSTGQEHWEGVYDIFTTEDIAQKLADLRTEQSGILGFLDQNKIVSSPIELGGNQNGR